VPFPIGPIFEYPRSIGISITGGLLYHGRKFTNLKDAYLCADYGFGRVIALHKKNEFWEPEIIAFEPSITCISIDPRDGELLFCNMAKGKVMRLIKTSKEP